MLRLFAFLIATVLLASGTSVATARDTMLAQAQLNLRLLGFDPGSFDGSWGGKTQSAFEQFYGGRGGGFDGKFSDNEVDDIYAALSAVPFNGARLDGMITAANGRTVDDHAFDFVPARDLAAELPDITTIVPFDQFSARIRTASGVQRNEICGFSDEARFPAAGKSLKTYASFKEFETTANRVPHPGNIWLEDLKYVVATAAERIAANPDRKLQKALHDALLAYSSAGVGLDSVNLLDNKTGKVIVTPDFVTAQMVSTSLTLNYLLVKPRLRYTAAETAQVERWLDRLFETFADSYVALNGDGSRLDPRGMELVGRATMANGMLRNDPATFNRGAKMAATVLSLVREDGSHRFGASRGFRALYYSGVSLMMGLEDMLLIESQGLPARELFMPNIDRMAGFVARAHTDNSVLWPYARENVSVTVGRTYKVQEKLDPPSALDLYFAVSPEAPVNAVLKQWRATYSRTTQITESFNGTCMGLGLSGPLNAYATALAEETADAPAVLEGGHVAVAVTDDEGDFFGYRVTLIGAKLDGKLVPAMSFDMLADFLGGSKSPENLNLLRIALVPRNLMDEQSRSADYSDCGELAVTDNGPNLHFGGESTLNECVLGHMSAGDANRWQVVLNSLPQLVKAASSTVEPAVLLDRFLEVKPIPSAED